MHAAPTVTALALVLLAATATQAVAQGLASPGPLSSAHAGLDNLTRCLDCHDAGRELSGRKCLTCHVSIAAELRADRGYHALATRHGTALACGSCHSEHNGRPFDLISWRSMGGRDRFDHAQTGWPLEGAHARQRCEACHTARLVTDAAVRADRSLSVARTYLGLGTACASCHLDEHRGRVGPRCERCHTVEAWKPARFDHARTRFPLTGRHAALRCAQCHSMRTQPVTGPTGVVDSSFLDFRATRTGWDRGCVGCHASPHRDAARVGACERCHTTAGWFDLADSVRHFDHAAVGFPLRGAHAGAPCESCHLATPRSPLPAGVALVRENFLRTFDRVRMVFHRCDACHASVHQSELAGAFASEDCAACHDQSRFTPTSFSAAAHDSSAFPLTGAHRAIPCSACHKLLPGAPARSGQIRFRFGALNCAACHDDPHRGQFAGHHVPGSAVAAASEAQAPTACTPCHDTREWSRVTFDHDSTRYPLRGAHRTVACGKCHTPPAAGLPARFTGLGTTCSAAGCHADPHGGQFAHRARGSRCTTCHTETAWASLRFDHQRDSDFPLDGAHRHLKCAACHRAEGTPPVVRYLPLPHRCEDCHAVRRAGGAS
jgi:hypothetical protein